MGAQASGVTIDKAAELREWLLREPPQVPPRYFYDEHGSELFEKITHTPEYYPTRTELALLEPLIAAEALRVAHELHERRSASAAVRSRRARRRICVRRRIVSHRLVVVGAALLL